MAGDGRGGGAVRKNGAGTAPSGFWRTEELKSFSGSPEGSSWWRCGEGEAGGRVSTVRAAAELGRLVAGMTPVTSCRARRL